MTGILFVLVTNKLEEIKEKNSMAISYMTKDGYNKLLEEISYMESEKRPAISRQIAEARDKGDLSENAEYDAAKEAQGILEAKISQLKTLISNARLIDESQISTESVQILNKVTIRNTKNDQKISYTLVSESETDLKAGKIAVSTPIGKGLMGKKVGEVVEIKIPSGVISFEIMDISI
jgi:transcription elongation factor GreA